MRLLLVILFSWCLSASSQVIRANKYYVGSAASSYSYLLDTYTGASVGYSMYKLRSAYTGKCLKVRRSSDNTESDIDFVNNFLDTATLKTFVGTTANDSGFVSKWYDQSGNASDAVQATAGNQPRIIKSGVIDGGAKARMRTHLGVRMFLVTGSGGANSTFQSYIVTKVINSTLWVNFSYGTNGAYFTYAAQSGSSNTSLNGLFTSPSLYANNSLFSGTTRGNVYTTINGDKILNINGDASGWGAGVSIYGYNDATVQPESYTGEVIIWNSDQSSNRTGIFSNQNTRWGVY